MKRLCRWLLYDVMGWKTNITQHHPDKYIICLAPHTSNWDFIIGQLYARAEGISINYLMKKEWFFWPLGNIFRRTGGIPVFRQKNMSMTDSLSETAQREREFKLCITPEGTRKPTSEWKRGFYYIALKAELPILLYGVDFERRLIECTETFTPTGDYDHDIVEIKQYFKNYKGKKPENYIS